MLPDNQLPPHHAPTGLKIWLAVFGVVLVVALGYLVWVSNTAPDTTDNSAAVIKKSTKKTEATTTAPAKTDETADWGTYASVIFGYTIKYPNDWEYKDFTNEITLSAAEKNLVMFRPKTTKVDYLHLVSVRSGTVAEAVADAKETFKTSSTFVGEESTTINGQSATKITFQNNGNSSVKPTRYILQGNNFIYVVSGPGESDNADSDAVIAKMVNTFKFTN